MTSYRFEVEGSSGDIYKITAVLQGGKVNIYCSCPAGSHGQACKHRLALLDGYIDNLVSDNEVELELVLEAVGKTKYPILVAEIEAAAAKKQEWARREKSLKKQLGREMESGLI